MRREARIVAVAVAVASLHDGRVDPRTTSPRLPPLRCGGCVRVGGRYEGAWKDSLRHGVGVMHDPNGEKHEGEFYRGQKHGPGTFRATNGQCRDGEWFYDERKRWTGKEYFGRKPQKKR